MVETSEDQIRNLLTRWEHAFRAKDAAGVMAVYASGDVVVAFDVVPPLAKVGSDAYRRNYEEFFAMFKGPWRSNCGTYASSRVKTSHSCTASIA